MGRSLGAAAHRTGLVATAAVAATVVTAGLILANLYRIENPDHGGHIPWIVQALLWIAAGVYVTRAWPMSRIGPVIILGGFSHFLYAFGLVPTQGTWTLGWILGGLQILVLSYLVLSYPTGAPRPGLDRTVMFAVGVWWVISTAINLLVQPSDLNPLHVITDAEARSLVWNVTPIVSGALAAIVLWRVIAHRQEAPAADRRLYTPIVIATALTFATLAAAVLAAIIGGNSVTDAVESWPALFIAGIAFPAAVMWVVTQVAPDSVPAAAHVESPPAEAG